MEEKAKSYGEALSKLIQVETVSASNYSGLKKFHAFHAVLKECFPLLFSVCEAEDFSGSLMLRWQGSNAKDKPPVMFMNHHDVVEADGIDWLYPPFSGTIADGKVCGRGTLDTKVDNAAGGGGADKRGLYADAGHLFCIHLYGGNNRRERAFPSADAYRQAHTF